MKKTGFFGSILLFSVTLPVYAVGYKTTILSNPAYDNSYAVAIDSGRIAGNCSNTQDPYPAPQYVPNLQTPMLWANSQSPAQSFNCGSYIGGFLNCMQGDTLGGCVSFEESPASQMPQFKFLSTYASLWSASTGVRTDLHPAGFESSFVAGCWGSQQVGSAREIITTIPPIPPTPTHYQDCAILWNGSADHYVNLHPSGYHSSAARAIWENVQVGNGRTAANLAVRALMWQGTAESVIDLHPSLFMSSAADDVWGNQQVGGASLTVMSPSISNSDTHALLWMGSATNYVDLHPDGFYSSFAYAVCNNMQAGAGRLDSSSYDTQALLWMGTAESVINLHQFLPDIYVTSGASDIDEFGNIIGTASLADGTSYIVLWQPVPEPATLLLLGIGGIMLRPKK